MHVNEVFLWLHVLSEVNDYFLDCNIKLSDEELAHELSATFHNSIVQSAIITKDTNVSKIDE